jgi:uncharacterized damage-inducible protein DinB
MVLYRELEKAFNGDPWHGKSAVQIVEASAPEKVFVHWIPNAHSIAEIVLHLTVWTDEAVERLNGGEAKTPSRGDWPETENNDDWQVIVSGFKAAHNNLMNQIENYIEPDWNSLVKDNREDNEGLKCTYSELVNGIVQHLAYHSGQISLLQKF